MAILNAKEFIKTVFIDELGSLINDRPYISFMIMGIGIELLGKCIDQDLEDWNRPKRSKRDFNDALKNIPSFQKYKPYIDKYDIYSAFRCGLLHSAVPKYAITLSSKNEQAHLVESNDRLNLKVEDFYQDFKEACEFVINDTYPTENKMNKPLLQVPGLGFNSGTNIETGSTSSLNP